MHRIVLFSRRQAVRIRGRAEGNELLVSSFVLHLFSSRRGSHLTGLPTFAPYSSPYIRRRPESQQANTGRRDNPALAVSPGTNRNLLHRTGILRDRGGEGG